MRRFKRHLFPIRRRWRADDAREKQVFQNGVLNALAPKAIVAGHVPARGDGQCVAISGQGTISTLGREIGFDVATIATEIEALALPKSHGQSARGKNRREVFERSVAITRIVVAHISSC